MKVKKSDYDKSIAQEIWYYSNDFLNFCTTASPKEVRRFLFSLYREYLAEEIESTREAQREMGLELNKVTDYLDNPFFNGERSVCKNAVYRTLGDIEMFREETPLTDAQSRAKEKHDIVEEDVHWFLRQYHHHIGDHVNREKLTAAHLAKNLGREICIFHQTLAAIDSVQSQMDACKRVKELTASFSGEHNPVLSARKSFLEAAEKREKEMISSTKYRKACYLVLGLFGDDESNEPRKAKKKKRTPIHQRLDALKEKLSEAECAYKTHKRASGSAYGNLRKS